MVSFMPLNRFRMRPGADSVPTALSLFTGHKVILIMSPWYASSCPILAEASFLVFDLLTKYQTLGLYQEYLELDLFQYGLQRFSEADFLAAGLTAADRRLIQFMAEQELGHIAALTNIIGSSAAKSCSYNYPFETVFEFFDFSQKITRLGESGVYGFLPHLNSRESAQVLLQIITTEARQQMIFRQIEGLFPVPVWFEVGIPQSWAWSILSPYIASCPVNQTRVAWQNFPPLTILNQVNPISANGTSSGNHVHPGANIANSTWAVDPCYKTTCPPYFNSNRTTLSGPGRNLTLIWESPGKPIGPNNSYVTTTSASGPAAYVAWLSQLNVTYTPLNDVHPIIGGNSSNTTSTASSGVVQLYTGTTVQPDVQSYIGNPAVNGTMFIAVTDKNPYVTPFNVSMLNPHVVAGPAMYQAS